MTFKPGQSGNPKGRPRGTRDRITEAFLRNLEKDWRDNGPAALSAAREKDPASYVRVVASLLPKDVNLNANVSDQFLELLKVVNAGGHVAAPLADGVAGEPEQSAPVRH